MSAASSDAEAVAVTSPNSPSASAYHAHSTPRHAVPSLAVTVDPFSASKDAAVVPASPRSVAAAETTVGHASVYPSLSRHPASWLRFVLFYVTDRDYHVWLMTFGFTLLFFAYPIQGVQTIRYPETGSYILLILYGFYGITSLFASPIIDLVGPEFCMPLGPLTYALWIASEFSGNNGLVLAGAAAFGWGAGLLWPAAGNILATVSTPHNRGSNNGIFQMGFHAGVFSGGLTLSGVIAAFSSYDDQYSVFLGLCGASFITFLIFIPSFRHRYRNKKPAVAASVAAVDTASIYRVVHDDGTVEFRSQLDVSTVTNANIVVADLALTGGRTGPKPPLTWSSLRARMYESVQFLWNPVFMPCLLVVASIGGVNQGWFNASFNVLANKVGSQWVGWVYAIGESFSITSSVLLGLFYDRLRKHYQPHQYRWVMYYAFFAVYAMCACALGTSYLFERNLGYGPGDLNPGYYKAILIATCFFYSTSWIALELSIYTYLTTFMVYNSDIGFSTKVFCEACGYMLSYGLVDVLSPRSMVIMLFLAHAPAAVTYLLFFHAPPTPAPVLMAGKPVAEQAQTLEVGELGRDGVKHTSSQFDLVKGLEEEKEQQAGQELHKEEP